MKIKHINNNNNKLIIFFSGWAHDYNAIHKLSHDGYDLLAISDYRKVDFEIHDIIKDYEEIHLIAWSLGVMIANDLFKEIKLKSAIAINGSLLPVNDEYGIQVKIFEGTLNTLSEASLKKFNRRMCGTKDCLTYYADCSSSVDIDDHKEELTALFSLGKEALGINNIFTKAIVSDKDAIFPSRNLKAFWEKQNIEIVEIDATHFPFNIYTHFNEILK